MIKENNLNSNYNLLQFYVLGEGDIKLKHGAKTKQQIFPVIKKYMIITVPPPHHNTQNKKMYSSCSINSPFYTLIFEILIAVCYLIGCFEQKSKKNIYRITRFMKA